VLIDAFELPGHAIRDVDGVPAEGQHGQNVALHGIADHQHPLRLHAQAAEDFGIRDRIFFEQDLDVRKVMFEP
jgi:hypothetical protein